MEKLVLPEEGGKSMIYESLVPQIASLVEAEEDLYANLANVAAVLKEAFNFYWVGFYVVKPDSSQHGSALVLGPFQGPLACTRIAYGKGVCGTSWKESKSIIVPDVDLFPGHIACSSASKSEIVVPIYNKGQVIGVLDIDSDTIDAFDDIDEKFLKKIVSYIS